MSEPGRISTVISDFGGVLTTPLIQSFAAVQDETGVQFEELGNAMTRIQEEDGRHPLFELETGRLSEADFLRKLGDALEPALGHRPELHRFREIYFDALHPNEPMIDLMREAKGRGYRMGLLTNNVREWEPVWRTMLPVDEIFEVVVDSGFVGCRKPDREIYDLTLERMGGPTPEECLFIDDTDVNCNTATELGMSAVHFRDNDQAIPELRSSPGALRCGRLSCRSRRGPTCRAPQPRGRAPSGGAARATRARARGRAPQRCPPRMPPRRGNRRRA